MKELILAILFFSGGFLFAQEKISPLQINPSIYKKANHTLASELNDLDSTFIYEFANLDLQYVWDDFSISKFAQYDADFEDDGVSSELFYRLMDETNTTPQDPELIFCTGEFAHHDTVVIEEESEVEVITHYPFTPYDVWVNELDFYPVEGGLVEDLYQECYVLVDSLIDGVLDDDQDTLWYNQYGGPAYVQDSARVFTKLVTDTNVIWEDNYAFHNYTFAYRPWSLGVATFDGVDENGRPYELGNSSAYGVADYLTSRPVNLGGETNVYLDFFYQAEGFGNMPDEFDSLIVDFWDESDQMWYRVWWNDPVGPDEWDTAHIAVPVSSLEDGFRFRFRNYASLSGALDHWHIDYVSLEADGFSTIDNVSDLAISYPLNTLLKEYTSVPWDHYKGTGGSEKMLGQSDLFVYNSDVTATIFANGAFSIRKDGTLEGGSPYVIPGTGVVEPNYLTGFNECLFDVAADYAYDQGAGGDQATFDVQVNIASAVTGANKFVVNDTTKFQQKFKNYYAYDDGSAEAAYGVEGVGSLMAYKFEAYEADTLTGILMHFVSSVADLSGEVFLLTVWNDAGGVPGEIIYQDDFFESHTPEYSGSKDGFRYYKFKNTDYAIVPPSCDSCLYLPVDEVFYVGWQNVGYESLNVGLDWNTSNGDKVYRNTEGSWLASSYNMSLLIRPVYSTALDYTLSAKKTIKPEQEQEINLYPNPANDQFTVSGLPSTFNLNVYDLSGRAIISVQNETNIEIAQLQPGIYLVDVRGELGESIYTTRLIKR